MIRKCIVIMAAALAMEAACVRDAPAQQRVTSETLIPDSVAQRVVGTYNRSETTRLNGDSRIPAGSSLTGDVAVLNGSLEVGGHIQGDVVALNGDVRLLGTATVDGSVTAAGGSVRLEVGATVRGAITSYRELLRLRVDGDQVTFTPLVEDHGIAAGRNFGFGRTDLLLAVHGSYNRVEGLPVAFGPRIRIGSSTRMQALAIYRTANGFETAADKIGYVFDARHRINGNLSVSGSLFREVATIEDWDLSDREASLAAFVLHRDYRDHYDRRGWNAGVRFEREGGPYGLSVQYTDETDKSIAPRDPFALMHNKDIWRPEPLVAEGRLRTVLGEFDYDTRNHAADPTDGWLLRSAVEIGLGGSLITPAETELPIRAGHERFTTGLVDVRRYARLTPYSRVAIRIRAEGALDMRASGLPAQRQLRLGGEGSLPAYPLASFDCGASRVVTARDAQFAAFYGCDRMAIAQIEYQASFPLARKLGETLGLGSWLTNSVRWAAFFDAGRAWTEPDSRNGRGHGRDDFSADTGLGVRLGPLGLYWAVPLSGSDHDYNFFLRLGPRF